MRTHVYAPAAPAGDKRYPGLLLYPEIYQQTGPIARLSAQFAGHGYVVMAPEIYHEHEPPGTVLAYDAAGTDKGNAYKWSTKLSTWDADVDVVVRALKAPRRGRARWGRAPAAAAAWGPSASASAATWRSGPRSTRRSARRAASMRPTSTAARS